MAPSLDHILYEIGQMRPLIPTYIHLILSVVFPIYTAAHASLARPPSAAPSEKRNKESQNDVVDTTEEDEEVSPTLDTLSPSDAILFPILAGATLASLYFILKWLQDPALLNYYLGLYFAVVGLFFNIKFITDGLTIVRSFLLPNQYSYQGQVWRVSMEKRCFAPAAIVQNSNDSTTTRSSNLALIPRTSPLPGRFSVFLQSRNFWLWSTRRFLYTKLRMTFKIHKLINFKTPISVLDIIGAIVAIPLVYYHTFIDKPWFLTNILGFSFCYGSLQYTTPGTSWTGSLLLSALFFYDIYFVFYTPMMVTVATKLDVPIKLLFPRPDGCVLPVGAEEGSEAMQKYLQCIAKKKTMAMIGLGDIVIPGIMMAFALRFDLNQHYQRLADSTSKPSPPLKHDRKDDQQVTRRETGPEKEELQPETKKYAYLPATGSWGERFWTTTTPHTKDLTAKRFSKPYFTASVVGYVLGIMVTVTVMQVFQHAQPALLYLVPGVLLSLWTTALVRGELVAFWKYSEVPDTTTVTDKDSDNKEKKNDKIEDDSKKTDTTTSTTAIENKDTGNDNDKNNETTADVDQKKPSVDDDGDGEGTESRPRQIQSETKESKDTTGTNGDGTGANEPRQIIHFDLSIS